MLDSTEGGCRVARSLIDPYTSGELGLKERAQVLRHLDACRPCSREFEEATRLRRLVGRAVRSEAAPERLRQNIRELTRRG